MKKIKYLLITILFVQIVQAQSYQINDKVNDFTLKNIDNTQFSLYSQENIKGAIIVFTCNHCPYAKLYEQRIIDLDVKYKKLGYPVIAINPNDPIREPDDSFENMVKIAKEKKYTFPYLIDETQNVAKQFGATRTPHVFLLQKKANDFVLAYTGAIDNNPQNAGDVTKMYLSDAIENLLKGEKIEKTTTKSIGCTIKWK